MAAEAWESVTQRLTVVEGRAGSPWRRCAPRRTALNSLKESGDLGYAADVVCFLTKAQEHCATPLVRAVELTVAKDRHVDTGKVGLSSALLRGPCTRRRGHRLRQHTA